MCITAIWFRFRIPESWSRPLVKLSVSHPVADLFKMHHACVDFF